MEVFSGLIGMVGLAGVLYALVLLNQLSRKLGAVTKMAPYYRGYYVAAGLVGVAALARLLATSVLGASLNQPDIAWLNDPLFLLLAYHLPLALALTLSLGITWRYWSWLLREA